MNAPPPVETSIRSKTYEVAGLGELARAVDAAQNEGNATLRWYPAETSPAAKGSIPFAAEPERVDKVGFYSPSIFLAPVVEAGVATPRILFLLTGAETWTRLTSLGDFDASPHGIASPSALPVKGAALVDLTSDETARATLSAIDFSR